LQPDDATKKAEVSLQVGVLSFHLVRELSGCILLQHENEHLKKELDLFK
jgi:hypothetical protein